MNREKWLLSSWVGSIPKRFKNGRSLFLGQSWTIILVGMRSKNSKIGKIIFTPDFCNSIFFRSAKKSYSGMVSIVMKRLHQNQDVLQNVLFCFYLKSIENRKFLIRKCGNVSMLTKEIDPDFLTNQVKSLLK